MQRTENRDVLAVDVGGTKILIGEVSDTCEIKNTALFKSEPHNPVDAVEAILGGIETYLKKYSQQRMPERISIGIRGHVDNVNGIWLSDMMISGFTPVHIKKLVEKRTGIHTCIDNDIHCATLAEKHFGVGRKYKDFIYINIGTGIAAGIVADGHLVRGESNFAGEFGHVCVELDGIKCVCGSSGCLEPIASGGGIAEQILSLRTQFPESILDFSNTNNHFPVKELFRAYEEGDELSLFILNRAISAISCGITGLINLLNPSAIILGGGLFRDDWIFPKIEHNLREFLNKNKHKFPKELRVTDLGQSMLV